MRPTVIRLIAGGALGIAFSISLTLPGTVVFPDEPRIRQLAAPEPPTATVLHAAPLVKRPNKTPARSRVVVRRASVQGAGTVPATSAARYAPPRATPSRKFVERAPVERRLTPLAAAPAAPVTEPEEEPKEADEARKADKPRKAEKRNAEKPRKADKPEKAKKPKHSGSEKKGKPDDARRKDRDDQGDDRNGRGEREHSGGRRGDDSSRG
jgi:hypothetical protein